MSSGYGQDIFGGFWQLNPLIDSRIRMSWQGVGPGTGRAHLTFGTDADQLFNVKDIIAFCMNVPEAYATLGQSYDDTFTFLPFDFGSTEGGNGVPITVVPQGDITITPADGFTLSFRPGWSLVWLLKTAAGVYSLHGDLVPA